MTMTASTIESLTLNITQEVTVRASLESTFEALLEQMGPANETPEGVPLPMVIEPRPGGRWFRDLGNDNGHFWGQVQAIKRPTLIEITGPLFMSSRRVDTVSPLIGWSLKASPSAVQSLSVPVSKSKLRGATPFQPAQRLTWLARLSLMRPSVAKRRRVS